MQTHHFKGQHSDEKVLYEVKPHIYSLWLRIAGVVLLSILLCVFSILLVSVSSVIPPLGIIFAIAITLIASWILHIQYDKTIAYITDRRLVRFEAHHPFHVATRSLNWDDTMKVKTYPPHFIWSMLNIGTVVLHARSSIISLEGDSIQREVAGDDLELKDVWYYEDLGNYIEKILYTNKRNHAELADFRPFVPKPKGQRY